MKKQILFLTILLTGMVTSQTYSEQDKEGLRNFLRQPSAIRGQLNLNQVNLKSSDTLNWYKSDEWINKIASLNSNTYFIQWNEKAPKRISNMMFNSRFGGKLNCKFFPKLEILSLLETSLTGLDLSDAKSIKDLTIVGSKIRAIDFSAAPLLKDVVLKNMKNRINDLDFSRNTNLFKLDISGSKILNIDLSQNVHLVSLFTANNHNTNINISLETFLVVKRLLELDIKHLKYSDLFPHMKDAKYNLTSLYQSINIIEDMPLRSTIDLSTESSFGGVSTHFEWYVDGKRLNVPSWTHKFYVDDKYAGKKIELVMNNSFFKGFIMKYEFYIKETNVDGSSISAVLNKSSNEVLVYNAESVNINKLELYDMRGNLINEAVGNVKSLNLKKFSKGVYLFKVYLKDEVKSFKIRKDW